MRHVHIGPHARRAGELFLDAPFAYLGISLLVLVASALSLGLLAGVSLVAVLHVIAEHTEGRKPDLTALSLGLERWRSALVVGLVIEAATVVASFFLVVPGVALATLWWFAPWYVAMRDASAAAALRASWRLVVEHPGPSVLVVVAAMGLNLFGILTVVGVVVTLPLSLIFVTLVFADLAPEGPTAAQVEAIAP